MIKSMTGYGCCKASLPTKNLTVEIRSVNHRYFEFSCRMPRSYNEIEDRIKSYVQSKVSRGKIEVSIQLGVLNDSDVTVECNMPLAEQYYNAYKKVAENLGIEARISVNDIVRNQDVLVVSRVDQDADEMWNELQPVLDVAINNFIAMREKEGEKLKNDVISRVDFIEKSVEAVEIRSPQTIKEYREKLENKIHELLGDATIDEQRILTETAIYADKIAVDEETVRLRSHLSQIREMLNLSEPIGRKLDFIVQETNRETNTIGSKAQDIEIAHIVVDVKSEIEKIREQIQNIE